MKLDKLSAWIKDQLVQQGMKQDELAQKSRLSSAQISRIINMLSEPSHDALISIARALHQPPEVIFKAAGLLPWEKMEMVRRYLALSQIDLDAAHRRASPVENLRL